MVVDTPIIVTESSRIHLWRLVYFLGWAEATAGVTLMVLVSYPIATLTKHLPARELLLYNVYHAQLFIGVAVTVVSIDGILVNRACLYNPFLVSTKTAFRIWHTVGIILTILTVACLFIIPTAIDKSGEELIELLHWGSRYYLTDLSWKESFDSIHQDFKCCGINSVNDWLTNRWIPLELFRPETVDLQDSVLEDGSLTVRVVPASCCDPDLPVECFHDHLQQNRSGLRPELVMAETVFTRGCGPLILDSVQWVTPPFMALTSVILTLKIGQLVIGRCLYNLTHHHTEANSVRNESLEAELSDRDETTDRLLPSEMRNEVHFSNGASSNAGNSVEQFVSFESFESAEERIPVYHAQIEPRNSSFASTSDESTSASTRTAVQCRVLLRPARAALTTARPPLPPPAAATEAMALPAVRITPETIQGRVVARPPPPPSPPVDDTTIGWRHRGHSTYESGSEVQPPAESREEDSATRHCSRRRVSSSNRYEYDLLQPVDLSKLL